MLKDDTHQNPKRIRLARPGLCHPMGQAQGHEVVDARERARQQHEGGRHYPNATDNIRR